MDNPHPRKEYNEGPEAAKRFDNLVRHVISVPREEIKKRDEEWKKGRKKQAKRARS
jgi:hypothetical protein